MVKGSPAQVGAVLRQQAEHHGIALALDAPADVALVLEAHAPDLVQGDFVVGVDQRGDARGLEEDSPSTMS